MLNGTVAANQLYGIYALRRDSDGFVEFGFLSQADSIGSYLPTGYSTYRWIGFVVTDSSANIRGFNYDGDALSYDQDYQFWSGTGVTFYTLLEVPTAMPTGRMKAVKVRISSTPLLQFLYVSGTNGGDLSQADDYMNLGSGSDFLWERRWVPTQPSGFYWYVGSNGYSAPFKIKALKFIR